ncbi:type II toxin-antitoxin system RelE/ParE family toxin [bacterium]|nr:type II toxin-antitoxin system RelE/ParE family toxin [bacterium]
MFSDKKYKVKKIKQAESEYDALTTEQQSLVDEDYKTVEQEGIHRVSTKKLEKDLYEIRTDTVRSLYTYRESELIVVVTIFVKKKQKTPEQYKKLARKRIKNLGDHDYD